MADLSHLETPRKIVDFEGEKAVYHSEVLEEIIYSASAEESQVFVISITGVFRTGKSFFLSLFKTYLDYICENRADGGWEEQQDIAIQGVRFAGGQRTVTQGIWMWLYPNRINGKTLLFMDCQGTGDNQRSSEYLDHLILFLGVRMANVQILNVKSNVRSNDLARLEMCAAFADDGNWGSTFENLVFLIRDWDNDEEPDQLDVMYKEATSTAVKKSVAGIQKAFKSYKIFALPDPGKGVKKKSESDHVTLGNADIDFLKRAKEVFRGLLSDLLTTERYTGDQLIGELTMFPQLFADQKLQNAEDMHTEAIVKKVFDRVMKSMSDKLQELIHSRSRVAATFEDFEKQVDQLYAQACEEFETDPVVQSHMQEDITHDYTVNLKLACDDILSKARFDYRKEDLKNKVDKLGHNPFDKEAREKLLREREKLQEELQEKLNKPNMLQRALRKITRAFGKIPKWFAD